MGSTVFRPDHGAGSKAVGTLRDTALYVTKLPKAEHDAEEWQAAMEALLLVAESGESGGNRGLDRPGNGAASLRKRAAGTFPERAAPSPPGPPLWTRHTD